MGLNPFKRPRVVVRDRQGRYQLRLDDEILEALDGLAGQLDPLLEDPSADPGLRRLFPPAHPDDVLAEAAWQIEQGERLRESRRASLDAIRLAPQGPMDEAAMIRWMQGVNALRLVLAERLGVSDDEADELERLTRASDEAESEDPAVAERGQRALLAWSLYDLLGLLVSDAVDALDLD